MKRCLSLLLALLLMFELTPIPQAFAESTGQTENGNSRFVLPNGLREIEAEAFSGNTSIQNVVVPSSVEVIGARAFAGCKGLQQISLANPNLSIADDAFSGIRDDALFFAHDNSQTMVWILSHGFACESLDEESDQLAALQNLLAISGYAPGTEQSVFSTKCLIVRNLTGTDRLPDISLYHPVDIFKSDKNLYFVQFETGEEAQNCFDMLNALSGYEVEPDRIIEKESVSAAGVTLARNWGSNDVMGFDTYAPFVAGRTAGSVKIAVIDTGVRSGSWTGNVADAVSLVGGSANDDTANHGSSVASIINDCMGLAASNATLMPIKAINGESRSRISVILQSLKYAETNGADIVNMSFGWDVSEGRSPVIESQIQNMLAKGTIVVGAAGNGGGSVMFPACVSGVTTVSALTYSESRGYAVGSRVGAEVDFTAPGIHLYTKAGGNVNSAGDTIGAASTSFAAPQITAALALLRLDPAHGGSAMSALISCCDDLGTEGLQKSAYGNGLPRLDQLVKIQSESIQVRNIDGGEIPKAMWVGEDFMMGWKVLPEDATDKTVTITVDDTNVLKVKQYGTGNAVVTALKPGNAVITLTCGAASTQVQLHVEQPVTKIDIVGAADQLILGKTMQLSAVISPNNAGDKGLLWSTSNPKIATVLASGLVTPVAEGKVSITCEATDGYGTKASVNIEVIEIPDVVSLTLSAKEKDISQKTVTLVLGEQLTLLPEVKPDNAPQDVNYRVIPDNRTITLTENGIVFANAPGTVTLIATAGKITDYLQITVVVMPTSVTINAAKSWMDIDEQMVLSASLQPANVSEKTVSWSSSNTKVATVNADTGLVTAIAPGDVQITCEAAGGIKNSIQLTVRQPITVTFDANGGSCYVKERGAYSNYALGTLPTPSRAYYSFDGWYSAAEGGVKYTATSTLKQSATLYAHWSGNPYTVTLDADGGTVNGEATATMQGTVGSKLGTIPNPVREYYDFLGWYSAEEKVITSDYVQSNDFDLILTAHWKARPSTITFDANGGVCDTGSIDALVDSALSTLPTPTRSYYVFDGWFTAREGGTKISAPYTRTTTDPITLYAHWTPMKYTITFNANGGACETTTMKGTVDTKLGTLPEATRQEYTFLGWYLADGTPITKEFSKADNTNITLIAHWKANPYTVSFDACGGTVGVPSIQCVVDSPIGDLPKPERQYYDFLGWFTASTGGTQVTSTYVKSNSVNMTLFAHWTPHKYTITINANGGKCAETTRTVSVDQAIGNLPDISKSYYTFDGWYTAASGGTKVTSAYKKSDDSNMTLYAHWTAGTYTITWNANGGSCSQTTSTGTVDKAIGSTPTPTRSYYTFNGWYTAASGGTKVDTTYVNKTTDNKTFYAQWSPMEYTMKFDLNGGTSFSSGSSQKTGKVDTAIGTLPVPVRAGYDFAGWYDAASGGNRIDEKYVHTNTSTKTVYAHWNVKQYGISWSNPANGAITVKRTSSPLAGAAAGAITSGVKVYHGDVLSVSYTAATGYSIATKGSTSITVSGTIGSSVIYATTTPNNYTYNIVCKSSNGTALGTYTVTNTFGSTYSISPSKSFTGYTTPAAQNVAWDSTNAKTITFVYAPATVNMAPALASGNWWTNGKNQINYSVSAEIQSRTATSVQIRFKWTNTITKYSFYGYQQHFTAIIGSVDYGATQIITNSTWNQANRGSNPPEASKTVYSAWKTIPVSATTTSVSVSGKWYDANYNNTWSANITIPAY